MKTDSHPRARSNVLVGKDATPSGMVHASESPFARDTLAGELVQQCNVGSPIHAMPCHAMPLSGTAALWPSYMCTIM